MQNTVTARRISYNLIALIVMLVAVGVLVGFAAGVAVRKPSAIAAAAPDAQVQAQTNLPGVALANAPIEGWIYHHDSVTNKWYAYHYSSTSMGGPVVDDTFELEGRPDGMSSGCGLNRTAADC